MSVQFEYLEVRPVIAWGDRGGDPEGCESFHDERLFEERLAELSARLDPGVEEPVTSLSVFWTIYGIQLEDKMILPLAIGDFKSKEAAHEVLNAICAPMRKALEVLDASNLARVTPTLKSRADQAATILEDFLNQCSNEERI